jgi:PPOX class probable F420-dependent enzyme
VHGYLRIDEERVAAVRERAPRDYSDFAAAVREWLATLGDGARSRRHRAYRLGEDMTATLDDAAIQTFLATKEVVLLATVLPDGAPLAMPMWFLHDRTSLAMITLDGSRKVRNLRRDPRVCVVAESGTRGDIRGVTVRGRVEFLADSAERRRLVDRFLAKYDPNLEGLWHGRAMPPNRVMFRIVPERVRSWGLGG